jgi:hypothetical protein
MKNEVSEKMMRQCHMAAVAAEKQEVEAEIF